ncbi:hypothetical protein BH11GEM2_BH11GEM2_34540 [soil metagenome]
MSVDGPERFQVSTRVGRNTIVPLHIRLYPSLLSSIARRLCPEVAVIVVESRFRVANGMEEAVRVALLVRTGLVEPAFGLLVMRAFQADDDLIEAT